MNVVNKTKNCNGGNDHCSNNKSSNLLKNSIPIYSQSYNNKSPSIDHHHPQQQHQLSSSTPFEYYKRRKINNGANNNVHAHQKSHHSNNNKSCTTENFLNSGDFDQYFIITNRNNGNDI